MERLLSQALIQLCRTEAVDFAIDTTDPSLNQLAVACQAVNKLHISLRHFIVIFFDCQGILNEVGYIETHMKKTLLTFLAAVVFMPLARSQDEETIQKLFKDAIEAMGGDAFLKVTDMVSDGQYFAFNIQGESSGLIKFADYTKLPDKSRFELGNRKKELDITVFNLEKNEGWILEGQKETRDATPAEMKDFRSSVNHSIDNIFRFRYKDPQNKLFYLGPGEGQDVTLDMVKIIDPENDEVTIYFDRISKLPAKTEHRSVNSKGVRERHVQEFSQWHMMQGVNTPMRIDGHINGRRSFQQFILKITYNNNLPDSFFSKPVPPK
jgi:hypothetical protein